MGTALRSAAFPILPFLARKCVLMRIQLIGPLGRLVNIDWIEN